MKKIITLIALLATGLYGAEQLYSVKVPQVFTYSQGKPQYIDRYVNPVSGSLGLFGIGTDTVPVRWALGSTLSVSNGTLDATGITGTIPISGISGLGTGVATALAVNTGSAGAFVVNGGALGTPSSGTATNLTGTSGITGTGALTSGSIGSGFGSINVGANSITGGAISGTTGTFTAGILSNDNSTLSKSVSGSDVYWLVNNTDTGATSRATYQMKTGVSANVWQMFARNNQVAWGIAAVADYMTLDSTGLSVTGTLGGSGTTYITAGTASTAPGSGNTTTGVAADGGLGIIYASRSLDASAIFNVNADATLVRMHRSGSLVGSISVTTTATAYNTSSDRRLKTNIREADHARVAAALDKVLIRDYDWRANGKPGIGPIAQELAAADPIFVILGAVTPGDDAVVDYDAWRARKARVSARADRNEKRKAAFKQALEEWQAACKAAQASAKAAELVRQKRLGKTRLAALAERDALLAAKKKAEAPEPLTDEYFNPLPVKADTAAIAKVEAKLAENSIIVAAITTADRSPVVAAYPTAPTEPVYEHDPEDDIKDFVQWQVDNSKLVPLLLDYAQQTRKELKSLEARVAALEAK